MCGLFTMRSRFLVVEGAIPCDLPRYVASLTH